jgi:hypothetical protein
MDRSKRWWALAVVMGTVALTGCAADTDGDWDEDWIEETEADVAMTDEQEQALFGGTPAPRCMAVVEARSEGRNSYLWRVRNRCSRAYTVRIDVVGGRDTSCKRIQPGSSASFNKFKTREQRAIKYRGVVICK